MHNQEFIDGVREISISGGVVRVDLFTYSTDEKGSDGKFEPTFSKRLLMSPEGFLRTFSAMEKIVDQLVDKGAIKRKSDNGAAA
ncbi:MAG: hypothetical protein AAF684_06150, partial [Pseudomonadota bacterium]